MSAFHNSREAEKLALAWHVLGAGIGIGYAAFAVATSYFCYAALARWLSHRAYFEALLWFALASVINAGVGTAWHLWAIRQHRTRLVQLKAR